MIETLFFIALTLIPMTSIAGIGGLGELQHEASAYIFMAAIGLSVFPALSHFRIAGSASANTETAAQRIYVLPLIMVLFLSLIAVSLVPNFATIKDAVYQGRGGLEKFISSTILVAYGFGLAFLTYYLAGRKSWDRLIVLPLAISVALCAGFSFFEIAGRFSGGMASLFAAISKPFYGGIPIHEWDTRLRSFAFEPPDFANTAGYIWPWLLSAILATSGGRRTIFAALFAILNVMIVLSEARTSMVVIGGLALVFLVLRLVLLPPKTVRHPENMVAPVSMVFALLIPAIVLAIGAFFDQIVFAVVSGDNVSNLSRLASMTAALRMFEVSPLYGFGFGQFGFHAAEFMPSWGFYSYEIQRWLFGPIGYWPAVYSVYARFAAELGLLGLLFWLSLWLWLARTILVETLRYRARTGILPSAALPLILSCFTVLLAGVPCDSIRAPMIWINLGLTCRYLATLRAAK